MITAIYDAGLVTLPYTPSPMNFLNKILSRPKNESPVMILPVGYPKKGAMVPDIRRKAVDEVIKNY
jgi:nitroreductase